MTPNYYLFTFLDHVSFEDIKNGTQKPVHRFPTEVLELSTLPRRDPRLHAIYQGGAIFWGEFRGSGLIEAIRPSLTKGVTAVLWVTEPSMTFLGQMNRFREESNHHKQARGLYGLNLDTDAPIDLRHIILRHDGEERFA